MLCQRNRIADPGIKEQSVRVLRRLHHAHDGDIFPVLYEVLHVLLVVGLIPPYLILAVILVIIRTVDELECDADDVLVGIGAHIVRRFHIFLVNELLDHLVQLHRITKPQCIEHEIADPSARGEHKDALIVVLRPVPCLHVVLALIQPGILRHLIEHIRAHHGGHQTVRPG